MSSFEGFQSKMDASFLAELSIFVSESHPCDDYWIAQWKYSRGAIPKVDNSGLNPVYLAFMISSKEGFKLVKRGDKWVASKIFRKVVSESAIKSAFKFSVGEYD